MNSTRRGALAAIACLTLAATALAQPAGATIKLVVPFPPGQGADTIMRLLAESLSPRLKQPIIIDNRPGAGGAIGTDYVTKQAPDGLTLLMGSSGALAISPTLQPAAARYNPIKDFEPITGVAAVAQVFVVRANSPIKDLKGLIQAAKEAPGSLSYGSSGNGTTQHLFVESFAHAAGVKLLHVPYKGAAPAFNDLMGGQLALVSDTIPALLPHIKAGSVRALGVTSAERSPMMPDVPTIAESGVRGFSAVGWITVVAPPGLPAALADKLDREIRASLAEPALAQKIRDMGFVEMKQSREALRGFIGSELAKWKTVIDSAGIKAN